MHVERGISVTDLGTKRVDPQFGSRQDGIKSLSGAGWQMKRRILWRYAGLTKPILVPPSKPHCQLVLFSTCQYEQG